jgi:hypothetical protein
MSRWRYVLEFPVWLFIWATHWTGWHTTYPSDESGWAWCADCLRWKRARGTGDGTT